MGFLSQIANVFTGSEDAKARRKAGRLQEQVAQQAITEQIVPTGQRAIARFDPLAQVAQQGIDLADFLTDPQQQAQFAQQSPLFDLSRRLMTEDINQSAAARGRLTAGDTLERLQMAGTQAAQPLIDRQRQDILNLLNLGQGVAGQQAGLDIGTAQQVTDLLTGGAAARAAGIVGAQDARTAATGNIVDLAGAAFGLPPGTFTG